MKIRLLMNYVDNSLVLKAVDSSVTARADHVQRIAGSTFEK